MDLIKKVNALEPECLAQDSAYRDLVLPVLNKSNIQNLREVTIPITRTHDSGYWGSLQSIHQIFLAKLDYRLWHCDDSVFEFYVRNIATIGFPAISIFDRPFDYECPVGPEHLHAFEKKLFDRTKIACQILKNKKTLLLSPAISHTQHPELLLDYLVHNRNLFDVYALHCCFDGDNQKTAELTTLLNQCLKTLHKTVWVTRWAIPSCNHPIESKTLQTTAWRPLSHAEAAVKMRHLYHTIESITKGDSQWFFTGLGIDNYNPKAKRQHPFWQKPTQYPVQDFDIWTMYDFLGMCDYSRQIKEPILNEFLSIVNGQI